MMGFALGMLCMALIQTLFRARRRGSDGLQKVMYLLGQTPQEHDDRGLLALQLLRGVPTDLIKAYADRQNVGASDRLLWLGYALDVRVGRDEETETSP